ncbi:hypothetical protein LC653_27040 [Nostoc sp. CHAB 5784]|uniref:hypothetical protein n=1 Tax=Nostoc mirabile TaxID=2907820 RepID=UPI001E58B828|nr:hypothetical protein [Nostoc mirabile]MCC5667439.1 hypothetical protein [Nostoc mirabile CHAB5784]
MSANLRTRAALAAGIMLGGMTMLPGVALSQSQTPGNITGRWSAVANTSAGSLNITQSANGAISGTFLGTSLDGYYNPSSRRLVFVRIANGIPFQFYSGYISSNGLGLGGQFNVWTYSPLNEGVVDYNFSATKVSDFPN